MHTTNTIQQEPTEIDLLISDLQKMLADSPSDEQRKAYESKLKQAEKLQIKYIETLKKLKLYKDTHGAEYFKPLPHQQHIFDFYFAGKKTLLLQGGNQLGKEQPIYSKVYTPHGVKTIGELIVGDEIIGEDGMAHKITAIYPQGIKPVYRVTFNDGFYTDCGLEHLWKIKTSGGRFRKQTRQGNHSPSYGQWKILSLKEIVETWGYNPKPKQRISIPMCEPVQFIQKEDLKIHPYLLGVLIGDGGLCHGVMVSSADNEIIEKISKMLPPNHKIKHGSKYDYRISGYRGKNDEQPKNEILDEVRNLKLNVKSQFKFVPEKYKYTSAENRIELLRGLMDTDGSIYDRRTIEFCSMSKQLTEDVIWLVQSLGGQARLYEKNFKYNDENKTCYRAMIRIENINPFYLSRKAERHYVINHKNERLLYDVKYIGNFESICIAVDSKDHTYLTDNFIVTHNTIQGVNFIQANCLGYLPWDKEKKTLFIPPIKVRIICADWDHHASEVIIPKLYQYFIFDEMVKLGNDGWGKKNQVGVESFFQYKNGSTIELMTSKLNKQAYEGWTGHIIWGDEPFPKFIYDACVRGLSEANGITLFTLTSVDSDYDWILEDIIESPNEEMQKTVGAVRGIHSYANTYIPKANFDRVSLGWDENTRKARLEGGWYSGQGKVWSDFNYDTHVIDEFKIPTDWPVTPMIDFHPCIEQAIGFYAVDKPGWKYVVDEVWQHLSAEEIADEIIRRKTGKSWRIDTAYIDPYSKGDNKMMTNRMPHLRDAFTVIKERLSKHGIRLEVALKDKSSGIVNIKNWLLGPNKMPSLKIFRKCKRHIYEMKKWEKDENGMPSDKDDHMCENIYRYSLTGTVWTDITIFNRQVEFPATAVA